MRQLLPQLPQKILIRLALHVAQRHIGGGALRQLDPLQPQVGIADAPPQQRRVLHQVLHESVVAAPQHPAGVRLLHGAGGKMLYIQQQPAGEAVDDHQRLAGEHAHDGVVPVCDRLGIAGGDVPTAELLRVGQLVQRGQRLPPGDDPLQNVLLRVAVYHPQPRRPSADGQVARRHVEALPHAQQTVQRGGLFTEILRCHLFALLHTVLG